MLGDTVEAMWFPLLQETQGHALLKSSSLCQTQTTRRTQGLTKPRKGLQVTSWSDGH